MQVLLDHCQLIFKVFFVFFVFFLFTYLLGSVTIPLGIAPTARGSILSNEYDLIIEIVKSKTLRGTLEMPITVYRDVENALTSPSFSPHLRGLKYSHIVDAALNSTSVGEEEDEDDDSGKTPVRKKIEVNKDDLEDMQQLQLT